MTNARKSREKHRMERAEMEKELVEEQRIKEMADRNEIFNCSGTQTHTPMCDEDCGIRVLDELEIAINDERKRWEELGMTPLGTLIQIGQQVPGVPVDMLQVSIALGALTELCYELGIDKEKLNKKYQEMYLDRLTTIREVNETSIREARAREMIAIPGANVRSPIILPGGKTH